MAYARNEIRSFLIYAAQWIWSRKHNGIRFVRPGHCETVLPIVLAIVVDFSLK
jgi:hypothetical protein